MKIKYFIGIILTVIVITPSITFASWWNPFTWFHFSKIEKIETIQIATSTTQVIATTTSTSTVVNPTTTKITNKIKEVEKVPPQANHQICQSGFIWDEQKGICAITATATNAQKCEYYYGVNSIWSGNLNNSGAPICSCKTGWVMNKENTICVLIPVPVVPQKTNDQLCQDDFGSNSIWNGKLNSNGGLSCGCRPNYQFNSQKTGCEKAPTKTPVQICQERFGVHATVSNTRDDEGNRLCECEDGYVTNSSKTTCQKQQQGYDGPDPYGVFNDGVVYSPEQRAQIECAYYGGASCYNQTPVQIYNTYQYTPPAQTQAPSVNCSNYQIEKDNLDESYSQSGTLFSGARVSAENALKARYPGCY